MNASTGLVISIVGDAEAPHTERAGTLLGFLGFDVRVMTLEEAARSAAQGTSSATVLLAPSVSQRSVEDLAGAVRKLVARPVLICGAGRSPGIIGGLRDACGLQLRLVGPVKTQTYQFARTPVLWPFGGTGLTESRARVLDAIDVGSSLRPLIWSEEGSAFASFKAARHDVFISTAGEWLNPTDPVLRRSFNASSFLDTLPLLVFGRHVLGGEGWTRPTCQANVIIDDPNLRRASYGYLDYSRAVELARTRDFHMTLGFVPLDYRTTSSAAAEVVLANPEQISIVMHGNDHLKRELARPASQREARFAMAQALQRMEQHRRLTGIRCPRVMTMPHGASSPVWIEAMAHVGFTAAISGRSYAFVDRPEDAGAGPLHEMLPAETSLFGLPILNRYPIEGRLEELLFLAWLGKPLNIYTHHGFFAGGWDPFLAAIEFINRQIRPQWVDVQRLVTSNHLVRRNGSTLQVRAFSNQVIVQRPEGIDCLQIMKEGAPGYVENEELVIDGRLAESVESRSGVLGATVSWHGLPDRLSIDFVRPREVPLPPRGWEQRRLIPRARRFLTVTRDRLQPVLG